MLKVNDIGKFYIQIIILLLLGLFNLLVYSEYVDQYDIFVNELMVMR